MFKNNKAFSSFSVDNINKAKSFYGDTLGLDVREEDMGLSLHIGGSINTFIYPKENHQPATFTVLNFVVDDIDKTVEDLKTRGIKFEHYKGELQTNEKGIMRGRASGPDIAWFKDPAGNVLSVLQEK